MEEALNFLYKVANYSTGFSGYFVREVKEKLSHDRNWLGHNPLVLLFIANVITQSRYVHSKRFLKWLRTYGVETRYQKSIEDCGCRHWTPPHAPRPGCTRCHGTGSFEKETAVGLSYKGRPVTYESLRGRLNI